MSHFYSVTLRRATAVHECCAGFFLSPLQMSVAISHGKSVAVYSVAESGLVPEVDVPFPTDVMFLRAVRCTTDPSSQSLIVVLQQLLLVHITFREGVRIEKKASLRPSVGPSVVMQTPLVDSHFDIQPRGIALCDVSAPTPKANVPLVAIKLFERLVKIVPLSIDGKPSSPYVGRVSEHSVVDMVFLPSGRPQHVLSVLHADNKQRMHVATYTVDHAQRCLVPLTVLQKDIEQTAMLLVPVATNDDRLAAFVIGEHFVSYIAEKEPAATRQFDPSAKVSARGYRPCAASAIDDNRLLVCRENGALYIGGIVDGRFDVSKVADTPVASCVTYVDNGHVLVGSAFGDTQLLNITSTPPAVVEQLANVGPIKGLIAPRDSETSGQCRQVVVCGGAAKEGAISLLRLGVPVNEEARLSEGLDGVSGIWDTTRFLVLGFVNATRAISVASLRGNEDDVDYEKLYVTANEPTVLYTEVGGGYAQVLHDAVCMFDEDGKRTMWPLRDIAGNISTAAAHGNYLCIAAASTLAVLELSNKDHSITLKKTTPLPHDVASVLLHRTAVGLVTVVGLWESMTVSIVPLEGQPTTLLTLETVPRSLAVCCDHLLVGTGDGCLYATQVDANLRGTSTSKRLPLGSKPVTVTPFTSSSAGPSVFCSGDYPAMVYFRGGRLQLAGVGMPDVTAFSPIAALASTRTDYHSFVVSDAEGSALVIGSVDAVSKAHTRSFPLASEAKCLVYHSERKVYVTGVSRGDRDELRVLHTLTFDCVASSTLPENEFCNGMCTVPGESNLVGELLVVGTALTTPEESEPHYGRVVVYSLGSHVAGDPVGLRQVAEHEIVKGSVFAVASAGPLKVAAGVYGSVEVYKMQVDGSNVELVQECSLRFGLLICTLRVCNNTIIAGDLCHSLTFIQYDPDDGVLSVVGRDTARREVVGSLELDVSGSAIASDESMNMFVLRLAADSKVLEMSASCHVGEQVNTFCCGSFATSQEVSAITAGTPVLFGTINGRIGCVVPLKQEPFAYFQLLENAIRLVVSSFAMNPDRDSANVLRTTDMMCQHDAGATVVDYLRGYHTRYSSRPINGFVDGDLIEEFPDYDRSVQQTIVDSFNTTAAQRGGHATTVDDVLARISDVSRVH